MPAAERLARAFLTSYPRRAARVLEGLPVRDAARFLGAEPAAMVAEAVARMAPDRAAACLAGLPPALAGNVLLVLSPEACTALFRRLTAARRRRILGSLEAEERTRLERIAAQPDESIGAHAEPARLAIPHDVTAREAERRIRRTADAGNGTVFVIDQDQRLLGTASLHDVLRAPRETPVGELARDDLPRLQADWHRDHLLEAGHWRNARELPVVDADGHLIGAVTHERALRLREEGDGPAADDAGADTLGALGDLYVSGLIATIENLTGRGAAPAAAEKDGKRGD